MSDTTAIDPRLLDDDHNNENIEVDERTIQRLEDHLVGSQRSDLEANDTDDDEEAQIILQPTPAAMSSLLVLPSIEVINALARHNVVKNASFAAAWNDPNPTKRLQICDIGISRDDPTPYMFSCSKTVGCAYKHYKADHVHGNKVRCTPKRIQADSDKAQM